jgi:hypothetical protein
MSQNNHSKNMMSLLQMQNKTSLKGNLNDEGNAKRAAGSGDTAGKEDSDKVAVEQNGESLFSTLPNSDAANTNNVLPGPSSGNSNNANNTNPIVGGVSAHIEKGKMMVSMLTIYFIRLSGANYSDFK